jgi:hypothetical protein
VPHPPGCLDAVRAGHAQVHEDDVRLECDGCSHGFLPIARVPHDLKVGLSRQHPPQSLSDHRMVVNDKHPYRHSTLLSSLEADLGLAAPALRGSGTGACGALPSRRVTEHSKSDPPIATLGGFCGVFALETSTGATSDFTRGGFSGAGRPCGAGEGAGRPCGAGEGAGRPCGAGEGAGRPCGAGEGRGGAGDPGSSLSNQP